MQDHACRCVAIIDAPGKLPVSATRQAAIEALADMFAKDNNDFDRARFERACVPGVNVRK